MGPSSLFVGLHCLCMLVWGAMCVPMCQAMSGFVYMLCVCMCHAMYVCTVHVCLYASWAIQVRMRWALFASICQVVEKNRHTHVPYLHKSMNGIHLCGCTCVGYGRRREAVQHCMIRTPQPALSTATAVSTAIPGTVTAGEGMSGGAPRKKAFFHRLQEPRGEPRSARGEG